MGASDSQGVGHRGQARDGEGVWSDHIALQLFSASRAWWGPREEAAPTEASGQAGPCPAPEYGACKSDLKPKGQNTRESEQGDSSKLFCLVTF